MQMAEHQTQCTSKQTGDQIDLQRLKLAYRIEDGQEEAVSLLMSMQETLTQQAHVDEHNKIMAAMHLSLRTADLYNTQADGNILAASAAEKEGNHFESIVMTATAIENRLSAIQETHGAIMIAQQGSLLDLGNETFNGVRASGEFLPYQEIARRLIQQQEATDREHRNLFTNLYRCAAEALGQHRHHTTNPFSVGLMIFHALRSIQQAEDAYKAYETKRQIWQSKEQRIKTPDPDSSPVDDAIRRILLGKGQDTAKKDFEEAEARWHLVVMNSIQERLRLYDALNPQIQTSPSDQIWTPMTIWCYEYRMREIEHYLWVEQHHSPATINSIGVQKAEESKLNYLERFRSRGIHRNDLGSEPLNWQHIHEVIEQRWPTL